MKRHFKRTVSVLLTLMMTAAMFTFLTTTANALQFSVKVTGTDIANLEFNVEDDTTIGNIKSMIQNQINEPAETQQLLFGSTILEDNKTLEDYNIVEGSTITLLPYPFKSHSVALDGDICINFYLDYELMFSPESEENNFTPIKFTFEWVGEDTPSTNIDINDVTVTEDNLDSYYNSEDKTLKIPCYVSAAEIASPVKVTASIDYDNDTTITYSNTYSVKDYAMEIINNSENYHTFLVDLAKKLLDYGSAAQQAFNVNTDNPANAELGEYETAPVTTEMMKAAADEANPDMTVSLMSSETSAFGLKYFGTTLVFESGVTLRHYYRITDESAYNEAKGTAEGFELNDSKPGFVIYEKKWIPAAEWDEYQVFTIAGRTYNYSVMDYLIDAVKYGSESLKVLAEEAYWFNQSADAYFEYLYSFTVTINPTYNYFDSNFSSHSVTVPINVTSGGKTLTSNDHVLIGSIICVEFNTVSPIDEGCELSIKGNYGALTLFSDETLSTKITDDVTSGTVYFKMPSENITISAFHQEMCLAEGTMITLADGTKKAVEEIEKGDELLVWNLKTGSYDTAPVIMNYKGNKVTIPVIHTCFSDGTDVQIAREHGFFDLDLGEYVFINESTLNNYIGDTFVKLGDTESGTWQTVTLEKVWTETKAVKVYSPITEEHLCCFTEDILSVSGSFQGIVNIFEVDTDTLKYDSEKMQADIETYGLFDYSDCNGAIPFSIYKAFNVNWANITVGKGLITWDRINYLIIAYSNYLCD